MLAPLVFNLALSAWLLASAWIMPHGEVTSWNALVVALLAAAVSLLAFATPGRPGLRHGTSVLATWLVAGTMLLPHVALSTMANEVLIAMGFGAVDLLFPAHRKHGARPAVRPV